MLSKPNNYRNYSITNDNDEHHISNGRCPNYALSWSENRLYWSAGHDYFIGNGSEIIDGTKELREILSERLAKGISTKNIIFCDLDGVLADFEQGVVNKLNKIPDELAPRWMWSVINKSNNFFETLPWMPKGKELWSQIEKYNPIILTGVPLGSSTAATQKINWCRKELGPHIQVITCSTKDKHKYCLYDSILIDDRTDNLNAWNDKCGKFILYHENNLDSIIERINQHMV
jgi:5'(3')-deoxyribonucleotidase